MKMFNMLLCRRPLLLLCLLAPLAVHSAEPYDNPEDWVALRKAPSETECRSYIERALKEQRTQATPGDETGTLSTSEPQGELPNLDDKPIDESPPEQIGESDQGLSAGTDSIEDSGSTENEGGEINESLTNKSDEAEGSIENEADQTNENVSEEKSSEDQGESTEEGDKVGTVEESTEDDGASGGEEGSAEAGSEEVASEHEIDKGSSEEQQQSSETGATESAENASQEESTEATGSLADETVSQEQSAEESAEAGETETATDQAKHQDEILSQEADESDSQEEIVNETNSEESETATSQPGEEVEAEPDTQSAENSDEAVSAEDVTTSEEATGAQKEPQSEESPTSNEVEASKEAESSQEVPVTEESPAVSEAPISGDAPTSDEVPASEDATASEETSASAEVPTPGEEPASEENTASEEVTESKEATAAEESAEKVTESVEHIEESAEGEKQASEEETAESGESPDTKSEEVQSDQPRPEEEELLLKTEIPENLRLKNHIAEILKLDGDSADFTTSWMRIEDATLKELKRVYENAIKPLEILYKYRDLSNRHFGDAEIFSKPLILFMGPWSGGKSTIINYLLDNEFKKTALRTGAEPSPAYFNIVMHGDREEILDGTQLAADWTFSGLQKFGQGLLDRLRGLKMNHPLLEKVNIVEIPGILEIRKQVERLFPFNDACQWFIDRADIIFLVYDPSKLDVGPETEAILDQLKGREYQTRIILNKADQVRPEELMRVQGTLIWNISPLMSSTEPPVMYSTSLWSLPYETGSPTRLLFAQEKAFLRDLREAVEKRVDNKIAGARRFAVRVRNHAKMVDCYLTTYYNHKSFFGNKQKVAEEIIDNPQNYHIYEGLSTLTNISRYDLPDPDVYKDFFRLNPVYDFQQLASTCSYFRGCPINRLDVAIAYDLPELVGKYKKQYADLVKKYSAPKSP